MTCDICSKNDATLHLTEIVDGEMTKMHLCEECARKKGAEMEEHFGLSDLLAGLADLDIKLKPKVEAKMECPSCGLTYQDFRKTGRLGCGQCYAAFEKNLMPLLKRIHGSTHHTGKIPLKVPKSAKGADKLQQLRNELQRAIAAEEFEKAASVRDEIRKLEKKKK